jgi:hypothetical protein
MSTSGSVYPRWSAEQASASGISTSTCEHLPVRTDKNRLVLIVIIPLIIRTIRRAPSRSDATDETPNVSSPDPSGADQTDAEHQPTDLAVGSPWTP